VCGYIGFIGRTGISTVYSEYLLYEPITRIARHLSWQVHCEWKLTSSKKTKGDFERIDFLFSLEDCAVALEVKWCRNKGKCVDLRRDIEKLGLLALDNGKTIVRRAILLAGPHEVNEDGTVQFLGQIKCRPAVGEKSVTRYMTADSSGHINLSKKSGGITHQEISLGTSSTRRTEVQSIGTGKSGRGVTILVI
jgi:hypothetical protein